MKRKILYTALLALSVFTLASCDEEDTYQKYYSWNYEKFDLSDYYKTETSSDDEGYINTIYYTRINKDDDFTQTAKKKIKYDENNHLIYDAISMYDSSSNQFVEYYKNEFEYDKDTLVYESYNWVTLDTDLISRDGYYNACKGILEPEPFYDYGRSFGLLARNVVQNHQGFRYDKNGNKIEEEYYGYSTERLNAKYVTYEYDSLGKINKASIKTKKSSYSISENTFRYEDDWNSSDSYDVRYEYNDSGKLLKLWNNDLLLEEYKYDDHGNMTYHYFIEASRFWVERLIYEFFKYDSNNNLIEYIKSQDEDLENTLYKVNLSYEDGKITKDYTRYKLKESVPEKEILYPDGKITRINQGLYRENNNDSKNSFPSRIEQIYQTKENSIFEVNRYFDEDSNEYNFDDRKELVTEINDGINLYATLRYSVVNKKWEVVNQFYIGYYTTYSYYPNKVRIEKEKANEFLDIILKDN